ncbi:MAG: DUF1552 domain-containing protein, partial [Pseudomonadota bacterium]
MIRTTTSIPTTPSDAPRPKSVSRRRFLRGIGGASLTLPFLESLAPRRAWAQATPAFPKRVLFYYVPCGINGSVREDFYPKTAGTGFEITPMLKSLETLKSDFTFITGLENPLAKPDGPGDPASGTGAFLT